MSVDLRIQVPEGTINDIEKSLADLSKSKESVLKTAVNNTAKKAQNLLAQKASKEYTGPISRKSAILSSSDIKKATTGNPNATITFKSPVHEIKEFHVSSLAISKTTYRKNGKRGGKKIKGNVLKGSPKQLDHAFVVKFKSGHVAVVSRTKEIAKQYKGIGVKAYRNGELKPHYQKLRKLLSPSYKVMIRGERVYKVSRKELEKVLVEQVEKVLSKVMGG